MKKDFKKYLICTIVLLLVFIAYTVLLKLVDVSAIGPNASKVGFSSLNNLFKGFVGTNILLYNITDWAGLFVVLIGVTYGIIGLIQLIKRKGITKVDINLLALGLFYILVFLVYVLFEFIIINYRPILINGYLEASYPSSTTVLSLCFLLTSVDQTNKYIQNNGFKTTLKWLSIVLSSLMVIGRIISGVHWLTDIIGGILISFALIMFYWLMKSLLDMNLLKKND